MSDTETRTPETADAVETVNTVDTADTVDTTGAGDTDNVTGDAEAETPQFSAESTHAYNIKRAAIERLTQNDDYCAKAYREGDDPIDVGDVKLGSLPLYRVALVLTRIIANMAKKASKEDARAYEWLKFLEEQHFISTALWVLDPRKFKDSMDGRFGKAYIQRPKKDDRRQTRGNSGKQEDDVEDADAGAEDAAEDTTTTEKPKTRGPLFGDRMQFVTGRFDKQRHLTFDEINCIAREASIFAVLKAFVIQAHFYLTRSFPKRLWYYPIYTEDPRPHNARTAAKTKSAKTTKRGPKGRGKGRPGEDDDRLFITAEDIDDTYEVNADMIADLDLDVRNLGYVSNLMLGEGIGHATYEVRLRVQDIPIQERPVRNTRSDRSDRNTNTRRPQRTLQRGRQSSTGNTGGAAGAARTTTTTSTSTTSDNPYARLASDKHQNSRVSVGKTERTGQTGRTERRTGRRDDRRTERRDDNDAGAGHPRRGTRPPKQAKFGRVPDEDEVLPGFSYKNVTRRVKATDSDGFEANQTATVRVYTRPPKDTTEDYFEGADSDGKTWKMERETFVVTNEDGDEVEKSRWKKTFVRNASAQSDTKDEVQTALQTAVTETADENTTDADAAEMTQNNPTPGFSYSSAVRDGTAAPNSSTNPSTNVSTEVSADTPDATETAETAETADTAEADE